MPNNMTMKCVNLQQLIESVCADNMGGLAKIEVHYAEIVSLWPALPERSGSALSLESAGKWNGNLEVKEALIKIPFIHGTGEITFETQGEAGGNSIKYRVTCNVAKSMEMTNQTFGLYNGLKNQPLVVVATDVNGVKYLLGDENVPAMLVSGDNATSGKAKTDLSVIPFTFEYDCPRLLTLDDVSVQGE